MEFVGKRMESLVDEIGALPLVDGVGAVTLVDGTSIVPQVDRIVEQPLIDGVGALPLVNGVGTLPLVDGIDALTLAGECDTGISVNSDGAKSVSVKTSVDWPNSCESERLHVLLTEFNSRDRKCQL